MTSKIVLVNKPRFILILIGAVMLLSLSIKLVFFNYPGPLNPYTKGLKDKIIVLDAGHGGIDPGTQNNGINEKDITINVVREIERLLKAEKISVILTRTESSGIMPMERMSLAEQEDNLVKRRSYALEKRGSIFLSIHVNSSPSKAASGAVVYYQNKNKYFNYLATNLQIELNKLYQQKWTAKEDNFVVINKTEMPSVLVEIGFLTNNEDSNFINSRIGQAKIAQAVVRGLHNYGDQLGS